MDFQLIYSDFSCGNSLLNVRQKGVEKGEEMIFQTNDDLTNGSLRTVAAQIRIEFMAPRRSCRLNIQVNARSTSLSLKVKGNVQCCTLDGVANLHQNICHRKVTPLLTFEDL